MVSSINSAYLDCFSGVSGDMLLGALIDAGLSEDLLRSELAKLSLAPFELTISRQTRQSISATSLHVISKSDQQFRNLANISEILTASDLDKQIVVRSLAVFTRLAKAEAKVHGKPVDEIHFHEVGALDTIVDIVGCVTGFHLLGITTIHCSPLPLGRGFVRCAHGNLPLPAPAVCELLENIPVTGIESEYELVTPTGAALVAELVDCFGPFPPMIVAKVGYGAGDSAGTDERPNLLRLITGNVAHVSEAQQVEIIETHLDDWSPEGYSFLCKRLFDSGALDVSLTPIQMKKGRPAFRLTIMSNTHQAQSLKELIFSETSAIGLRFRTEQRMTLPREIVMVDTSWGPVEAKKVHTPSGIKIYPEYETCKTVAEEHNIPLDRVYREVLVKSGDV